MLSDLRGDGDLLLSSRFVSSLLECPFVVAVVTHAQHTDSSSRAALRQGAARVFGQLHRLVADERQAQSTIVTVVLR